MSAHVSRGSRGLRCSSPDYSFWFCIDRVRFDGCTARTDLRSDTRCLSLRKFVERTNSFCQLCVLVGRDGVHSLFLACECISLCCSLQDVTVHRLSGELTNWN